MASALVNEVLTGYRERIQEVLLSGVPASGPTDLYGLVGEYPSRPSKYLRPALCLAVCEALGGDPERVMNSAAALELLHNGFLIHDDIQDGSEQRRGSPTLVAEYGPAIALNVGNTTNLLALQRLMSDRSRLGSHLSWRILQETELTVRHSLEGQALEIGWIRDNTCDLTDDHYYRMCLKKTSWYSCIYPCRVGALVALGGRTDVNKFDRFGWYMGAAFQIQDDLLNLTGDFSAYGKEIAGDLWEGKRTLMVIHLLQNIQGTDRDRLVRMLGTSRSERNAEDVSWVREQLVGRGSVGHARKSAEQLAVAAAEEADAIFNGVPGETAARFLRALPKYVVERDR